MATILLSMGLPPPATVAMSHVTVVFTTASSGASHAYRRNVDWRLVARLAPAGMIDGVAGAYLLTAVDGEAIAPFVSIYLTAIGVYIAVKAFRPLWPREVRAWKIGRAHV